MEKMEIIEIEWFIDEAPTWSVIGLDCVSDESSTIEFTLSPAKGLDAEK